MPELQTLTYEVADRVARITLDRPERGNALTPQLIGELAATVEQADLDPDVHVILLAGSGTGFCGGYDLLASAEGMGDGAYGSGGGASTMGVDVPAGSPVDPAVIAANHDPSRTWDPMVDHAMMSRNVRAFMTLFHASTPVVCKVHGFAVAGGTDLALCSDLLVIAEDAIIGYPPARVWGSPTTALWAYRLGSQRAKRLLFTGDTLSGAEAVEWGLAIEAPPADELDARTEDLVARIARMPWNQLAMMKLLVNQSAVRAGPAPDPAAGDRVRRHHPPHPRGLRLPAARRRRRLSPGRPRPRRPLRRRGAPGVGRHPLTAPRPGGTGCMIEGGGRSMHPVRCGARAPGRVGCMTEGGRRPMHPTRGGRGSCGYGGMAEGLARAARGGERGASDWLLHVQVMGARVPPPIRKAYIVRTRSMFLAGALVAGSLLAPTMAAAQDGTGTVTVLHGVPDLTVDVYVNGDLTLEDFAPGTVTDPLSLPAGDYDIAIRPADAAADSDPAISGSTTLPAGANASIIAHLTESGDPTLGVFVNDTSEVAAGEARLGVRHTAAAPAVDIAANGDVVAEGLTNPNEAALDVPAATYSAEVRLAGTEDAVLGPADLTLAEGTATYVYAIGSAEAGSLDLLVQTVSGLHSAPAGVPAGDAGLADTDTTTTAAALGALGVLALAGGLGLRRRRVRVEA